MFREYEAEADRIVTFLMKEAEHYRSIGLPDEADALRRVAYKIEDRKHREQ